MDHVAKSCFLIAAVLMTLTGCSEADGKGDGPVILITTSIGTMKVELYPEKAPETVKNFLSYVESGFYDGTIFHRVIRGFMIQGGGFNSEMEKKQTRAPITNEANNGLQNEVGTLAMARTSEVDSATSQFFINATHNDFLDHKNDTIKGFGYCVFGKVFDGMSVVRQIEKVTTGRKGGHGNVPTDPVVIKSIRLVESPDNT